jgi:nucleotide-binding universal stress UspA family protein
MFKTILVPVDGSQTCSNVLKTAQDFYEKYGALIVLLHVDDTSIIQNYVTYPTPGMVIQLDGAQRSADILKSASEKLDIPDTHLKIDVLTGEPSSTILDVAIREDADLILMCTHGLGAAKRFLLGSVTNRVVHHAKIPVMIIQQDKS